MNTNTLAQCSTARNICNATHSSISENGISSNNRQTLVTVIRAMRVAAWLLRPESENEQPLFETRLANIWANTGKSLFWIGFAIATGFLIAQLSS